MQLIKSYATSFDNFLISKLGEFPNQSLYDPIKYIMDSKGKRIRPILAMIGCELFSGKSDPALPVGMAVEMFHNFTLVHDDIMDHADIRRGKEAVHKKFGTSSAILSGDAMMILSYDLMSGYHPEVSFQLFDTLSKIGIGLCEGQQMDMDFEERRDVTIDEYLLMIEKKTSILLGAALKMGSIVGGAEKSDQEHIYQFGKYIGIAFQIHDDILDVFGDSTKVGKIKCGDIINNKKTYLYLKALELADDDQRRTLEHFYSLQPEDPTDKIEQVLQIFNMLAVEEYANQLKEAYLHLGKSHLEAIYGDEEVKIKLQTLADFLISREL